MSVNSILNLMRELDLRGALAAFGRLVSSPQELDAMPAQLLLETLLQNEVNDRLEFGDIVYEKENVMPYSNCDCIFNLLYRIFQAFITFRCCRG